MAGGLSGKLRCPGEFLGLSSFSIILGYPFLTGVLIHPLQTVQILPQIPGLSFFLMSVDQHATYQSFFP